MRIFVRIVLAGVENEKTEVVEATLEDVKRGLQFLRQATEIDLSRDADQIYKEKEDWRFRDFFRLRFSAHTHFFDRDMVDNGGRWGQRTGDRAQRLRGGTIQR